MDVLLLDRETFATIDIYEGYSSLIWTERFFDSGEFVLKTPLVSDTIQKMPVGSFISLRDTSEVMMVETHLIEPDSENEAPELTVTGRSFNAFLENRVLTSTIYNEPWTVLQNYTPIQLLAALIWTSMVNDTIEDPLREWDVRLALDSLLAVPNIVVSTETPNAGVLQDWVLTSGTIYEVTQQLQKLNNLGVRTIRPQSYKSVGDGGNYYILDFNVSRTPLRGTVISSQTNNTDKMRLDIYQGTNRTIYQDDVDPVIFQSLSGHIVNQKNLVSDKEVKDYAKVMTSEGVMFVAKRLTEKNKGLNRKVMLLDGGSRTETGTYGVWANSVRNKATIELNTKKHIFLAEGEISQSSPYVYGRDYFLGDTITFAGNYASDTSMFVSEIVRTDDPNGETISPGLTVI